MTLDVLISTIDRGIHSAARVPIEPIDGVRWIVSWQVTGGEAPELPPALRRPDVLVDTTRERGLSRNRNNALRLATADICLIADDDVTYTHDGLMAVIDTFERHPSLQLATFQFTTSEGNTPKAYPTVSFDLARPPRGYYVSSIETAFRRDAVQGRLAYCELMGAGAPVLHAGEDELLVRHAVKAGLRCRYFPVVIVAHLGTSTGSRKPTEGVIMARGAMIGITRGRSRFPYCLAEAWRLHRFHDLPLLYSLTTLLRGARYARRHGID